MEEELELDSTEEEAKGKEAIVDDNPADDRTSVVEDTLGKEDDSDKEYDGVSEKEASTLE